MQRGEIWWAVLPPPIRPRPVVLLSRDEAYPVRRSVTIAPVTRRIWGLPVEVVLGPADGLRVVSAVNVDGILTVPKRDLKRRLGVLSAEKITELNRAVRFALDLD